MTEHSKRPSREDKRPRSTPEKKEEKNSAGEEKKTAKSGGYKSKRSFTRNKSFREEKSAAPKEKWRGGFERGAGGRSQKPWKERSTGGRDDKKGQGEFSSRDKKSEGTSEGDRFKKPWTGKRIGEERSEKGEGGASDRERKPEGKFEGGRFKKPWTERRSAAKEHGKSKGDFSSRDDKPGGIFEKGPRFEREKTRFGGRQERPARRDEPRDFEREQTRDEKDKEFISTEDTKESSFRKNPKKRQAPPAPAVNPDGLIRLNKYLSNAGIASRREADNLIQSGTVKVNGVVVSQLGYKIKPDDKVTYGDAAVKSERKIYLLLNKPKDYITTVDDPQERKTVMELIQGACRERIYPVGRLDRNTTGLLLFTNDGEMAAKLTHPKFGIKKIYHVSLNKGLRPDDFKAITEGVELEDGPAKADDLGFVGEGKKEVGIEIHSGRNHIVRRLFAHLGYDVLKLDRVVFAGLTKKDLPRGKHRFLTPKEVSFLKMLG